MKDRADHFPLFSSTFVLLRCRLWTVEARPERRVPIHKITSLFDEIQFLRSTTALRMPSLSLLRIFGR